MALAQAARRGDRLRFDYRPATIAAAGGTSSRTASCRCATAGTSSRFDLDRDDWRTFRVDRVGPPVATGFKTTPRPAPDAAALVAEGVAVRVYEIQARIRFPVAPAIVAREIAPTVAVIQPGEPDATSTTVLMGGDLDFIATYLASLPFPFEVLDPPAVRDRSRSTLAGSWRSSNDDEQRCLSRVPAARRDGTPTGGRWRTRRTRAPRARRR